MKRILENNFVLGIESWVLPEKVLAKKTITV